MQRGTLRTGFLGAALLLACGDSGSGDTGGSADGGPGSSGGPTYGGDDGSGDGATDGGDSGTGDGGGGPDAPVIVMLLSSAPSLTEGETITFTAVVTDPQGPDDILAGTLTTPDGGTAYGPFQNAGEPGSFSLDVSWQAMHMASPIDFTGSEARTFRAEFVDMAGHSASKSIDVDLTCVGDVPAACGGSCQDVGSDNENCGACGRTCIGPTQPRLGDTTCIDGECPPRWSECVPRGSTCTEACQQIGESCVAQGCDGNTELTYGSDTRCMNFDSPEGGGPGACDDPLSSTSSAAHFHCCCTDSG